MIGRVSVSIPFKFLSSKANSLEILIKDTWLVLRLEDPQAWNFASMLEVERSSREAVLKGIWEKLLTKRDQDAQAGRREGISEVILSRLKKSLLMRLRVEIQNVHIRFESTPGEYCRVDKVGSKSSALDPFAVGCYIQSLEFNTRHTLMRKRDECVERELVAAFHIYYRERENILYSSEEDQKIGPLDPAWSRDDQAIDHVEEDALVQPRMHVMSARKSSVRKSVQRASNFRRVPSGSRSLASKLCLEKILFSKNDLPIYGGGDELYSAQFQSKTMTLLRQNDFSLLFSAPEKTVDAAAGVTGVFQSVTINLPQTLIQRFPFLVSYWNHFNQFREQHFLAALFPSLCGKPSVSPKEDAKAWWRYAVRCVRLCQISAQPKDLRWPFTPLCLYWLQERADYIIVLKHLRALAMLSNYSESTLLWCGLKTIQDEIEGNISIPRQLLILWKRLALADPALEQCIYYENSPAWLRKDFVLKSNLDWFTPLGTDRALRTLKLLSMKRRQSLAEVAKSRFGKISDRLQSAVQNFFLTELTRELGKGGMPVSSVSTASCLDDEDEDAASVLSTSDLSECELEGHAERGLRSSIFSANVYFNRIKNRVASYMDTSRVSSVYDSIVNRKNTFSRFVSGFKLEGVSGENQADVTLPGEEQNAAWVGQVLIDELEAEGYTKGDLESVMEEVFIHRKVRFCLNLDLSRLTFNIGSSSNTMTPSEWLQSIHALALTTDPPLLTSINVRETAAKSLSQTLMTITLDTVCVEIATLARPELMPEKGTVARNIDLVAGLTFKSLNMHLADYDRDFLVIEEEESCPGSSEKVTDVGCSLKFFGGLGISTEVASIRMKMTSENVAGISGLIHMWTAATRFWDDIVLVKLCFPNSLDIPIPAFAWVPDVGWAADLDDASVRSLNRSLFLEWLEELTFRGQPLSLRDNFAENLLHEEILEQIKRARDRGLWRKMTHSEETEQTLQFEPPPSLSAPRNEFRLKVRQLILDLTVFDEAENDERMIDEGESEKKWQKRACPTPVASGTSPGNGSDVTESNFSDPPSVPGEVESYLPSINAHSGTDDHDTGSSFRDYISLSQVSSKLPKESKERTLRLCLKDVLGVQITPCCPTGNSSIEISVSGSSVSVLIETITFNDKVWMSSPSSAATEKPSNGSRSPTHGSSPSQRGINISADSSSSEPRVISTLR